MAFPEVKPNIKKVFLMNVIKIVSVALGILLLIMLFVNIVGSGFFQDVFTGLGFDADFRFWQFFLWLILAMVVVTVIILILNYFNLGNVRYEFQQDKVVYYYGFLFVLLDSKEIPYGNIAKINFEYEGFLNSLFNTGTITLELSVMKEKEFKMEFIDNAEEVAKYIQRMVQDYKSRYYTQRREEYNVEDILNKERI